MTQQYTYQEFFERFPEPYLRFERLVSNSENYFHEFEQRGFFNGVKKVLSIGCGEGALEMRLAKDYGLQVDCVDPSAEYIGKLEKEVAKRHLDGLVRTFCCGFQDFERTCEYDRIISVHSWYAFGIDIVPANKALSFLTTGGRLFITLVSNKSPIWRIHEQSTEKPTNNLSAEMLHATLVTGGLSTIFTENHRKLALGEVFQNSSLTFDAQGMISFLYFCPWDDLSEYQVNYGIQCLREAVVEDKVVLVNGCIEIAA